MKHWMPKILKEKKIASVFKSFDKMLNVLNFFTFLCTIDNLNLLIVYCTV